MEVAKECDIMENKFLFRRKPGEVLEITAKGARICQVEGYVTMGARLTGKEKLLLLQDNDPSQNSAMARDAMKNIGAEVVNIPPRSLDINPIENFFHNVRALTTEEG
eukprot:gene20982-biopygen15488